MRKLRVAGVASNLVPLARSELFWNRTRAAVAIIVLLWWAILCTLVDFWRVERRAGALLVPYLAWVSFATYLNVALWRLNPAVG